MAHIDALPLDHPEVEAMRRLDKRYWFMSYVMCYGSDGEPHFGSCTVEDHPLKVVREWNENAEGRDGPRRNTTLISYQEITAEEYEQFGRDFDFMT
jgi:hypothetical protein